MEHIALIVIDIPDTNTPNGSTKWLSFAAEISKIAGIDEPSRRLSETVWLFDLRSDLLPFSNLVSAADNFQLPYTVRFFSEPPILVRSSKSS